MPALLTGQALKDFVAGGGIIGVKGKRTAKVVKERVTELSVHLQVCKYIKLQYPNVMFSSDFAAGMKMSIGMASRQNMQKSDHAFPDLHIHEPRRGLFGLYIELKRDREALYNKDGTYIKSEHIMAQRGCIDLLNNNGYYATFACGFSDAQNIIDWYFAK